MKKGANPIEEMGQLMDAQMKRIASANKGISVELGKINTNMSLSVGSLSNAIPQGDYMVSMHLTVPSLNLSTSQELLNTETTDDHKHLILRHGHEVTLPEQLRSIQPGDRVLVAWVGTEPVVVDIVVSS